MRSTKDNKAPDHFVLCQVSFIPNTSGAQYDIGMQSTKIYELVHAQNRVPFD